MGWHIMQHHARGTDAPGSARQLEEVVCAPQAVGMEAIRGGGVRTAGRGHGGGVLQIIAMIGAGQSTPVHNARRDMREQSEDSENMFKLF